MKSLSRSTPLVLTKMSKGGLPEVYMWLSRVSVVMFSGFGYMVMLCAAPVREGGESVVGSVVEDETESSTSSDLDEDGVGEPSRMVDKDSVPSACLERIFCLMRVCENGVFWGRGGIEYSCTVARIDWVISSREV